jgi:hypothetical protein
MMSFLFSNEKLKSLRKTIKFKPLQGFKAADQFFNCSTSSVLGQSHFSFSSRLQMPLMESHVSGHGTQLTREFVKASADHFARAFELWKTKAAQVMGYWSRSPVHLASLLFLSRFCVQSNVEASGSNIKLTHVRRPSIFIRRRKHTGFTLQFHQPNIPKQHSIESMSSPEQALQI